VAGTVGCRGAAVAGDDGGGLADELEGGLGASAAALVRVHLLCQAPELAPHALLARALLQVQHLGRSSQRVRQSDDGAGRLTSNDRLLVARSVLLGRALAPVPSVVT